jgi:hypothetical protein
MIPWIFMKRRQIIRSIISLPAITAMPAVAQQTAPEPVKPSAVDDIPKLTLTTADVVAGSVPGFFSAQQHATLGALAVAVLPAKGGKPGASEAGVTEFLDFLIAHSPEDRQNLYRSGLDLLDREAKTRFGAGFDKLTSNQMSDLLAPLRQPWTFQGPSDELARFLIGAKEDIVRATFNSREWAAANGRRASGIGTYWYAVE